MLPEIFVAAYAEPSLTNGAMIHYL